MFPRLPDVSLVGMTIKFITVLSLVVFITSIFDIFYKKLIKIEQNYFGIFLA